MKGLYSLKAPPFEGALGRLRQALTVRSPEGSAEGLMSHYETTVRLTHISTSTKGRSGLSVADAGRGQGEPALHHPRRCRPAGQHHRQVKRCHPGRLAR